MKQKGSKFKVQRSPLSVFGWQQRSFQISRPILALFNSFNPVNLFNFLRACLAFASLLLLCSCETYPPRPANGARHQSPKAQAASTSAPQQTPKPPATAPQQSPKAQAETPPAPVPPPVANPADASRKNLLALDLAFSRACEEKGAPEAFYQFMALDGICLLAGDAPIQGRDAIKVHFAAGPAASISWKPRESEINSDSDLGYTWGAYESQSSTPENPIPAVNGKYAIVWKKQSDGGWKATLFITSPGSGAK